MEAYIDFQIDGDKCMTVCPYYEDGRKVGSIKCQKCDYNKQMSMENRYVVCLYMDGEE